MESLATGWAAEIARSGFGYLLFMASLFVLWIKDREIRDCRREAQADSKSMTEALVKAAAALEGVANNNDQRLQADEKLKGVLAALTQRIEMNDQLAKDRADRIVSALERRGGRGAAG